MLLEFKNVKTYFKTEAGIAKSVDGISFSIDKGQTVAIVGESGSGKSVTALSLIGLLSEKDTIISGEIIFDGEDLLKIPKEEMRKKRGNDISMIFQEPMTSLNPALKVGYQISEVFRNHFNMDKKTAKEKSIEMIKKVEIPDAENIYNNYPHELSGGMRQRIMIAMALSSNPKLLIADEPTTALDVTIQAGVLRLMEDLKKEYNTGLMFITHDLSVVAEIADYVNVMYAGKIVEKADVKELFKNPLHPYTKGLLKSRPIIGSKERLSEIEGQVPSPVDFKDNCHFCDRCKYAMDICRKKIPEEIDFNGHKVSCFLYSKERENE
ncbi:ABC transporter ATP-binding protein [Peptoniphilus stercorisuis]|uniref:Oligopeptide/dipeptide ABC transporter ATP-binding protein n=1 Tax=Peptoniphilus stercorisuis TaxID=1436965 RepID=A0ABS4KCA5_9FIRM|nr:ABC transporter ATP-binding protein [Peptoniphilus stercorisuis]MBP2025419.1 oligopeptide/dipeptide ABC transporter ATP-binding protein [Peptoniphilus stercorisuis]